MRQATLEEILALPYSEPFKDGRLQLFFVPKIDEFMGVAYTVRHTSTDKNHSTGAVVVSDGRVLSMESNKAGYKHPFLIRLHEKGWCLRKKLHIPSGKGYWLCQGCAKSKNHAETRAAKSARSHHPEAVHESTLYLAGHFWCCKPCSDAMICAGIRRVVLVEGARDMFKR